MIRVLTPDVTGDGQQVEVTLRRLSNNADESTDTTSVTATKCK